MVIIDRKELQYNMKVLGYTQKDLAEIINDIYKVEVNYRGLNKMINGKQNWSIGVALALVKILEIPFEQLFKFKWE